MITMFYGQVLWFLKLNFNLFRECFPTAASNHSLLPMLPCSLPAQLWILSSAVLLRTPMSFKVIDVLLNFFSPGLPEFGVFRVTAGGAGIWFDLVVFTSWNLCNDSNSVLASASASVNSYLSSHSRRTQSRNISTWKIICSCNIEIQVVQYISDEALGSRSTYPFYKELIKNLFFFA